MHSFHATLVAAALLALAPCACDSRPQVVVYSSVDEPYARPILEAFERESGIRVAMRFDTEADKTAGLFNRLIEERSRPRADVFWNSEAVYTLRLAREGVLAAYDSPAAAGIPAAFRGRGALWTGFASRLRVLIYNTSRVAASDAPRSIADLASPRWRGRATLALPLFGTTSTHAGALWARLGAERAQEFFRGIKENQVLVANGNAHVRDLVVAGTASIGLTDTDDAHEAIRRGAPVRIVFPDQEPGFPGVDGPLGAFAIPNTVALVAGGPEPEHGRRLIDHLLSEKTERALAECGSAQIPVRAGVPGPSGLGAPAGLRTMEVDYEEAARGLETAMPFLRDLFQR
jgi:iron(III) transport system substrate-binding protein